MDWQTLRNQFMRDIGGDPPGPNLELRLIDAYVEQPDAVERILEKVALSFKAGKTRSPWGVVYTELKTALDPSSNPTHDRGTSRAKAAQRAEQWMRTAGLHHDRETELLDELYGERGRLRDHPETRDRMLQLWHELRPQGQQLDQDAIDRGHRYQEQRARLANTPPSETPEQRLQRQRELAAKKAVIAHHEQPPSVYESDTMRLA